MNQLLSISNFPNVSLQRSDTICPFGTGRQLCIARHLGTGNPWWQGLTTRISNDLTIRKVISGFNLLQPSL